MSHSFFVSNGVRQGSVLSPVLFAVYLDGLLQKLSKTGVGCYWGTHFVGDKRMPMIHQIKHFTSIQETTINL